MVEATGPGDGLSVVIASFRSLDLVAPCLDAMERAVEACVRPVRVVLARQGAAGDVAHLAEGRPWLDIISCPADATVPVLRGAGMTAAGGGWIAVTEDHCLVDPDWLRILDGHVAEGDDVVGGGMGNARPGLVNWAAYFSEYGFFSSYRPERPGAPLITGANVLYGPEVSGSVAAWAREGLWEDVIHQRLDAAGARIAFEPAARARQNGSYSFSGFCRDRFEHGRDYARVRVCEEDVARAARFLATPLLPIVLMTRVRRAARLESPAMFRAAMPWTLAFLAAWSAGEAAGYLLGPPNGCGDG